MIAYVGTDKKEKQRLLNSKVYMAKTLTIKYIDQDGNKLKEVNVNAKKLNRLTFYDSSNIESGTIGKNVSSWRYQVFFHVIKYQV